MELNFNGISNELILGCIHKDRSSQKKLYNLMSPVVYTKILQEGYTQKEAEEVLELVFLEIFELIERYDGTGLFEDWCMEVCRRIKTI